MMKWRRNPSKYHPISRRQSMFTDLFLCLKRHHVSEHSAEREDLPHGAPLKRRHAHQRQDQPALRGNEQDHYDSLKAD